MKIPKITAHRGFPLKAIENTLESFVLAFNEGADFIEGDFWLTKDNQIICIHDKTLKRITNRKFNLDVTESNLQDLKKVDFISEKYLQKFLIPTLEEVIKIIPNGKGLFLEIKDNRDLFIDVLILKLKSLNFPLQNLRVLSYHANILKLCKEQIPEVNAYWIFDSFFIRNRCRNKIIFQRFLQLIIDAAYNGIVLNVESNLNEKFVGILHSYNLDVCVYGVNDTDSVRAMLEAGVDYIITDDVGLARKILWQNIT